jgi:hypothetical protein
LLILIWWWNFRVLHQLTQGEPRHRRARPRKRVGNGDGLRWSHADRRRSARRKVSARWRRRSARCSGSEAEGTRTTGAKCRGKDSPRPPLGFIDQWSYAPRIARFARINCRLLMDKRRIPVRSTSVRTPHRFHHGIAKVLVNPRSKGITSVQSTTTN